jgi:glycerate 2-kinase
VLADIDPRGLLRAMYHAAVAAASPARCVPPQLPERPRGRTVVVGAGKAAAAMAKAVEEVWDGPLQGLVVTRYGHAVSCRKIEVVEAAHPVADASGRAAAERILASIRGLSADDLVLCLISGGGSSLLALPAPGVTLEDKQSINKALARSGATIGEMNCLRKHLSAIKGGRLAAAAAPARVVALLISDVPGDEPSVIASGPTVADSTTVADARAVLANYRIDAPPAIWDALDETVKPEDPRLARVETILIATPQMALEHAAAVAGGGCHAGNPRRCDRGRGTGCGAGPCRDRTAMRCASAACAAPCVLVSGGETTVTVRGTGRGGRNTEFLLALAIALDGHAGIHALAADTDGIDGTEDNAGALIGPDTIARATDYGLDAKAHLGRNDGHGFFAPLGDLLVTGPTLTNVNDFRAILVTDGGQE